MRWTCKAIFIVSSSDILSIKRLDTDQFHILSDGYAFAIRSLSETADFRDDPRWIAARLGVQIREARATLQRLERLGLRERGGDGILRSTDVALTMAIDPAKLSEAKDRIRKFRRELCAFLEGGAKKEVFRLNVQKSRTR